jgi:hypothetical protein
LKKRLEELLCEPLKGRIAYFLTYYHKVHNSYGRAAIRVDDKDAVCFSWIDMYYQRRDMDKTYIADPSLSWKEAAEANRENWDKNGTYCESDFINAVQEFRQMKIDDALNAENYIIKVLAILDRRVGRRTLQKIADSNEYAEYPDWARQFYNLRLKAEGL